MHAACNLRLSPSLPSQTRPSPPPHCHIIVEAYKKYLQPEVVAQLENMELRARLVVEGFITGLHKSPFHGFSVEFAEHRQYRPGDEIKYIDWKVYSRTDRYYVKQFEEETNLRAVVAVDGSASMGYASDGNITKYAYATYLASALCYLMLKQKDAAGIALYDSEVRTYLPPRAKLSYVRELISALDGATPSGATGTSAALDVLAERIARRSFVVIISDFFDDIESVISAMKHFRHQRHDVLAIQVLDPREMDFDFGWAANFVDMESGEEMVTQPFHIQTSYKESLQRFNDRLRSECYNMNVDFLRVSTATPFDKALTEYVAKRATVRG